MIVKWDEKYKMLRRIQKENEKSAHRLVTIGELEDTFVFPEGLIPEVYQAENKQLN